MSHYQSPICVPYQHDLEVAIERNVNDALTEDVGYCDWTGQLVPEDIRQACIIVREEAVLCGLPWFYRVLHKVDRSQSNYKRHLLKTTAKITNILWYDLNTILNLFRISNYDAIVALTS